LNIGPTEPVNYSSHSDGGPAFPGKGTEKDPRTSADREVDEPGMSLRDWFAGQALAIIFPEIKVVARASYEIADAMLKERNKPPS